MIFFFLKKQKNLDFPLFVRYNVVGIARDPGINLLVCKPAPTKGGRAGRKKGEKIMQFKPGFIISPYINGTFFEFFGRTTYDGVWVGKDSDIPNVHGIRLDVIEGCKEAGLTICRWPGGCCAEKYHWKDGIGTDRKPRGFYWVESEERIWDQSFGTDEFMEFCHLTGMEPMLIANVTSGTAEEFQEWVEYCNGEPTTKYGAMRAANGHPEPYNVRYWGIGNTDENTWDMAYSPIPYAISFRQFRTVLGDKYLQRMRLIGLGFSIRHGENDWVPKNLDMITANGKTKGPDLLSIHHYVGGFYDKRCGGALAYTDEGYECLLDAVNHFQDDIDLHRQYIAEHTCLALPTTLSFDEWGAWHPEGTMENDLNQPQTLRDAIFAGLAMHIFYRNCDIVEAALETQLCNLCQSLFETNGKQFYKTPTFFVMKLFKEHRGNGLLELDVPVSGGRTDTVASANADMSKVVITCVNRHLYEKACLNIPQELSGYKVLLADEVAHENVRARNSFEEPNVISDHKVEQDGNRFIVKPHSVIRIVFGK